jgi:hypothetical protein
LAISAGMDGMLKVLNLEALQELFSIAMEHGILDLKVISLGRSSTGCLFSLADSSISLWRISSCCDFFCNVTAKIFSFEAFDDMQTEVENSQQYSIANSKTKNKNFNFVATTIDNALDSPVKEDKKFTFDEKSIKNATINNNSNNNNNNNIENKQNQNEKSIAIVDKKDDEQKKKEEVEVEEENVKKEEDRIVVAFANQEMRILSFTGKLIARMEPEVFFIYLFTYYFMFLIYLFFQFNQLASIHMYTLKK